MQDHSVRPTYYRLAPRYRRSAMYMLAGLLLIGAVSFWTARFKPKQGVPGIVSGYVVFAGFTVAMTLPLRWALRVDDRGVARRRVFGWDLWEWSDFASGRIRKRYPHTLVDPDRPWWRRRLRFEYMLAADTKQVLNLINAHYRLPPPPELPETLEIKYAFRRSATFDWRGIYLFVRGRPHEYLWNDIRRVHITRTDPLRRDFQRLEIYLPDQEIDLKVLITQGGPSPTWRGATPEVIDEFLRQYVPAEHVDVDISGERPATREDVEKKLNEARKREREFRIMTWIIVPVFAAMSIWMVVDMGGVALIMIGGYTAVLGSLLAFSYRNFRSRTVKLEQWLAGFDDDDVAVPPDDSPETGVRDAR